MPFHPGAGKKVGFTTGGAYKPRSTRVKGFSFPAKPPSVRLPGQSRPEFIASKTASSRPIRPTVNQNIVPSRGAGPGPGGGGAGPVGAAGAGGGGGNKDVIERDKLSQLRQQRLEAALAAIAAQFASQQGGLEAQQTALEGLFDTSIRQSDRDQRNTIRSEEGQAAQRGLGRSGIFAQSLAEALAPLAENRADIVSRLNPEEGAEGTEVRAIMSALELLGQQQSSAEATAELDSEKDELDIAQLLALMTAGLQG